MVDSIVLDGRDISYVNLEHVKTDEVVIRNMESLRYIDLENVEAERIIIEDTDVLGELSLRNVKVKEIIVRNSEIGGDFTLTSQLTGAASGNWVTVENLKVDGWVNVNLTAASGDVDGISIRDVIAGDVILENFPVYEPIFNRVINSTRC